MLLGDCLEKLKTLEDNSVDAIVTDPPYGLAFMGKKWDYDVPSKEIWKEALRVLKPGGHLLSFGGTRTYHRMVVNIEDAGFEIRDQIQWIYGQGFPKSHNIEKATGDEKYKGWGTALKPANEPICLARKPLEKGLTIAENVLKWGTGGLNIDATRVGYQSSEDFESAKGGDSGSSNRSMKGWGLSKSIPQSLKISSQGRFPANLILDETAAEMLGEPSRFFYVAKASKRERNAGLENEVKQKQGARPNSADATGKFPDHDHRETGGNNHPTVKPVKLMEYLCKLITPPNGIVLDPFMGSGTTGVAAKNLGFKFIGIEMNAEYMEIAKRRMG